MGRGDPLTRLIVTPGSSVTPGKDYYFTDKSHELLEVDTKYELEKLIGSGVYGVVCSGVDTETNERVAVKKMIDVLDRLRSACRALREIRLLRRIDHPAFPKVKDIMSISSRTGFHDVYLVQELMYHDLRKYIKHNIISPRECKHFLFQILRGLEYLHAGNVLHRDLKPANILVNENGDLKICDFGLARNASDDPMTSEVVTLNYRAPELLAQVACYSENIRGYLKGWYGSAIDVWSVGCIFAHLLRGGTSNVLFLSTPSEPGLLREIGRIIPKPQDNDLNFIEDVDARQFVRNEIGSPVTSLREIFKGENEEAIDLLEKMLVFHPRDRITAADAIRHPYLSDELDRAPPQILPDQPIDEGPMPVTLEEARDLLYEEMLYYHPQ